MHYNSKVFSLDGFLIQVIVDQIAIGMVIPRYVIISPQ